MHGLLLGKCVRVLGLIKAPSGHLAIKVNEYGVATEADVSTAFTIAKNPQCEETRMLIKETADVGPMVVQPAPSSAEAPAPNDARIYAMSQGAKGIGHSIKQETL
eukprot:2374272-Pyramimonas_sp.AAC.1